MVQKLWIFINITLAMTMIGPILMEIDSRGGSGPDNGDVKRSNKYLSLYQHCQDQSKPVSILHPSDEFNNF